MYFDFLKATVALVDLLKDLLFPRNTFKDLSQTIVMRHSIRTNLQTYNKFTGILSDLKAKVPAHYQGVIQVCITKVDR